MYPFSQNFCKVQCKCINVGHFLPLEQAMKGMVGLQIHKIRMMFSSFNEAYNPVGCRGKWKIILGYLLKGFELGIPM